jgi:hypothetical protein
MEVKKMKPRDWPTIKEIAQELRDINANVEAPDYNQREDWDNYVDVRLQVLGDDGRTPDWILHVGDASYDTDHHGYWGASSLPGVYRGVVRRFNSYDIARDLLD